MPSKTRKQKQRKQRGGGHPIAGGTERYTELKGYKGMEMPHAMYAPSMELATAGGRYYDLKFLAGSIIPQEYIPESDSYMTVTTFDHLRHYIANFLQNLSPYGTILHTGPLNEETRIILPILQRINNAGFIPLDSEIGAITYTVPREGEGEEEVTLNRPYIELLMPNADADLLKAALLTSPFIRLCEVTYDNEAPITLAKFPNFRGADGYKTIYIGTPPPENITDLVYILDPRNTFFMEVESLLVMILSGRGAGAGAGAGAVGGNGSAGRVGGKRRSRRRRLY